jgi:hypothetical protein
MPVPASCPCGKSFRLDDDLAGRPLMCPGCRRRFVLHPSGAVEFSAEVPSEPPETPSRCPSCNAALGPKASGCVRCGYDFRDPRRRPPAAKPGRRFTRAEDGERVIRDKTLAAVVEAEKRFCRICWAKVDPGGNRCLHCGAVLPPITDRDIGRARRVMRQQDGLVVRSCLMPVVAALIGLGFGALIESQPRRVGAAVDAQLQIAARSPMFASRGMARLVASVLGIGLHFGWGFGEYLKQDSRSAQNPVLRRRLRRRLAFLACMTVLSVAICNGIILAAGIDVAQRAMQPR